MHRWEGRVTLLRPALRWPLAMLAAAVLVCGAFLAVLATGADGDDAPAVPDTGSADAGFARDMIVHHQQAVEMSLIVRDRTGDEDVRRLAYDVVNTQANQRGMLLGWLDEWELPKSSGEPPMAWMGHEMPFEARDGSLMPGMATDTQLRRLREADGRDAEVLYLRLMTAHHQGGVQMSQMAAGAVETRVVRRLAETTLRGQQSEIKLMRDMLQERGGLMKP
ncbi:DUF305 domain-containing protein [Streptomyces sp. WAC 06738]|uniref:DUF305 domain-containing protein n=1 Tax=Streptomyces sp. WAC 06738 TaxID=2203210 RepID=UPI000F706B52|nr:DUF305 domain-containing protein [Streptomyces sp. WAC 06738]AZM50848.1 DUF305 domain-containing protein [Streptomyces sp. WAC 06738]